MKVYVVEVYDDDGYDYIAGVFADEAHAASFAERMDGDVQEHQVEYDAVETQTTHTIRATVAIKWIKWRGSSPENLSGHIQEFMVQHEDHDRETHRTDGRKELRTKATSTLYVGPSEDRFSLQPEHPHIDVYAEGVGEADVRRAYEKEIEKAKGTLAKNPTVLSHLRPTVEGWGTGQTIEMVIPGAPLIIEDGTELFRYRWVDESST